MRRAKLYYLRDLRGKKARIRERRVDEAKLAAMEATDVDEEIDGAVEAGSMEALEEAASALELEEASESDGDDVTDAEEARAELDTGDASADQAEERAEA